MEYPETEDLVLDYSFTDYKGDRCLELRLLTQTDAGRLESIDRIYIPLKELAAELKKLENL